MFEVARAAAAVGDLPPMEVRAAGEARVASDVVDVVLADCDVSAAELRDCVGKSARSVAVVLIDASASQEPSENHLSSSLRGEVVLLPTDATPREVRLACVLAASVVRWRRRLARRSRKEKRLRRLSFADPLTGVGNLRAWKARLAAACRRVRDEGAAVCLALFDVDRFKNVNDTYGHAAGDEVLRSVAGRLSAGVRVREGDFVARLGGDEFGLILSNVGVEHAGKSVERVRQDLSAAFATAIGTTIDVTASAGWCSLAAGDTVDAAAQRADAALRLAKRSGRDQTQPPASSSAASDEGERTA